MKKTYIIPETEVLQMENTNLLSASDPGFGGGGKGAADAPFRTIDAESENILDIPQFNF